MNDRVSAKPPSLYTGEEAAYKRNTKQTGDGEMSEQADTPSDYGKQQWYDAGIEPSRPSGMHRFGKAIANAFNPIWHGIHGIWKENKDEQATPARSVLQEREVKAENAYAELKKTGYKGIQSESKAEMPTVKYEDTAEISPSAPNRDSGIDVDEYRSSTERKRESHVSDTDEALMPPPPITGFGRSASPMSDAPSSQRSSLHVRKPSFQSLKKVKSHIKLPSAMRSTTSATPMFNSENDAKGQVLRKQPSRKELRLSKKVSDLEAKLEHARRDLRAAMGDTPPVPDLPSKVGLMPFKPGALPSLPSGIVFQGQSIGDNSEDDKQEVSYADSAAIASDLVSADNVDDSIAALADVLLKTIEAAEEAKDKKPTPKKTASKKRKSARVVSNDVRYKPDSDDDDDLEWDVTKVATPKKKPPRPRKAQKVEQSGSPGSKAVKEEVQARTKASKKSPSNTGKPVKLATISPAAGSERMSIEPVTTSSAVNSARKPVEPTTTSSAILSAFDPSKVDKAKLLQMRTEPNPFVPFGKLSDDIINLRKEFPAVTDEQLVNYFTSTSRGGNADAKAVTAEAIVPQTAAPVSTLEKKTKAPANTTFTAGNNQPDVQLLGRPRSTSSAKPKERNKTSKRSHSPPPAEQYSSPVEAAVKEGGKDEVITVDPAKDKGVPPMPKVPLGVEAANFKYDKPLPKIQKEDYEWPEDVF